VRGVRWPAALVGLVVALTGSPTLANASPPRPIDLLVTGGSDWHSSNRFTLTWTNPPNGGPPLVATHYRTRDPQGAAIEESQVSWLSDGIGGLTVPKLPGTYSAEVWYENAAGEQGAAATAQLRFDDQRPAAVEPKPVPAWIGRAAFPLRVGFAHPASPPPLSGIRGYAIAVGTDPDEVPCAAPDRCSETETTLRGGIEGDELKIISLPEGTRYLHVVAVSGAGMRSMTAGRAVLHVDTTDPQTQLTGAPRGWTNRAVQLSAHAVDAGAGMVALGSDPAPFTAIRVDGGAPVVALGDTASTSVIEEGVHRIAYDARDAAGNVNDGDTQNGIVDQKPGVAWVRIDRTPPGIAFANSQDPSDPELIRARIVDSLSGPDLSRGRIGVRRVGSGDRFEPLPQLPPGDGELRAHWDSDAYPGGEYEFQATGYDAAGNATAASRRRSGAPMVLSNPLKAATELRDRFQRKGLSRTIPFGKGLLLRGRLTTGLSSPLGGMPVRIVESFAAGAVPASRVSTARTGPEGTFSIRAAPGPSRTIALTYDGNRYLARSSGQTLRLAVRSRVQLHTSVAVARVGGPPLVFSGRVVSSPGAIPRGGKAVQLQFRLAGLPWSEFRTVQTDRQGRFRYAYRFSDDDSRGARFQFRAYAPAQDGWPYEPAGSKPIIVEGR
jgi:hypothetical protein